MIEFLQQIHWFFYLVFFGVFILTPIVNKLNRGLEEHNDLDSEILEKEMENHYYRMVKYNRYKDSQSNGWVYGEDEEDN